jgi:phosphoglycerate dehydrogenase-like enzyme
MDNVVITPHNGGGTWDNRGQTFSSIARGLIALINGVRPAVLVNPEVYDEARHG